MIELYKRNNRGIPINWGVELFQSYADNTWKLKVHYGVAGNPVTTEYLDTGLLHHERAKAEKRLESAIKAKRKEGYKEIKELHDNANPNIVTNLVQFLNTYLPKYNTTSDGKSLVMLAKTLDDAKPFEGHSYLAEWKIDGERCFVTATKTKDLFSEIKFKYSSREGTDWTSKLSGVFDDILKQSLPKSIIDLMLDCGLALDGEVYLPGYPINMINHIIKDVNAREHKDLQLWLYDLAIENMSAEARHLKLFTSMPIKSHRFNTKTEHLNNKDKLVILPSTVITTFDEAVKLRDSYVNLGFEGLILKETQAEYQFGKRNSAMYKYKPTYDGLFRIIDIVPEGVKRSDLPKFILSNDVNNEIFEVTINKTHEEQRNIFANKEAYIGHNMFVEYKARSGDKNVPFHAKGIRIEKSKNDN